MKLKYLIKKFFSSDKAVIEKKFFKVFGFKPDLKTPKRFNEIINWQKLYLRNPLMTTCTDKVLVRSYVRDQIGEEYLIPLLAHGASWDEIGYKSLEEPFIIKTNHGSGGNKIIKDKSSEDEKGLKSQFSKWLTENYYYGLREWQYKNIKPAIVVEKLLLDENGQVPADYKFYCFNYGETTELLIEITLARFTNIKRAFYTEAWEKLPLQVAFPMYDEELLPPPNLDLMCDIARKLSKPFKYSRVDLYNLDGRIFFGEITFSPFSGLMRITPDEWDFILGEKLIKTGILKRTNEASA